MIIGYDGESILRKTVLRESQVAVNVITELRRRTLRSLRKNAQKVLLEPHVKTSTLQSDLKRTNY